MSFVISLLAQCLRGLQYLAGKIGVFTVESAVFGAVLGDKRLQGVKNLFIRVALHANSQVMICNTDSEEINIEYSAGFSPFMPSIFSIIDCYGLKSLKVVSRDCIDISKVMSGIEGCPSLSEINLIAENFYSDSDGKAVEVGGVRMVRCLGYKRLKILRVLKKGNGEDSIDRNVFIQVPYGCAVECDSKRIASQIIQADK